MQYLPRRFLFVLLCTLAPSICLSQATIKVGVLHSLSGTMAISETVLKDVALMTIDEINAKGGVLGKKLETVVVDPASNRPLFAEKAKQLITQDKVAVVFGCWTSVCRKSVLPVFEETNSLLFYPVQYEGEELSKNVFYTGAAPSQQAIPAVEYLMSKDGGSAKRFVLLGTDYVYPRTTNKILRAFLKSKGITDADIMEEFTPFGHPDYQTIIAKIKRFASEGKKTAVVSTISGDSNVLFYKELGNQGLKATDVRVAALSLDEENLRSVDARPFFGHLVARSYFMSIKSPANTEFVKKWSDYAKAKGIAGHKDKPLTSDPMEATYIGIHMWAQAVNKAKSTDTDKVIAAMAGQTFRSPSGFNSMMDNNNHHLHKPLFIGEITEAGGFRVTWNTPNPLPASPWSPYLPQNGDKFGGLTSGGSSGGNRVASNEPLRPLPPLPTPQPPRPIPKVKGLNENRGQGDANSSPAVQSLVRRSGGPVDGTLIPAWNENIRFPDRGKDCNEALKALRAAGRIDTFVEPSSEARKLELAFLDACLAPVDTRLANRMGRVVLNGSPVCTTFLLTQTRAITARHCLFRKVATGEPSKFTLEMRSDDLSNVHVEFGPIDNPRRIRVIAIYFATDAVPTRHELSQASKFTVSPRTLDSPDKLQNDVIAIELESDAVAEHLPQIEAAKGSFGDKVYLPIFSMPAYHLKADMYETGFRQQVAGICQIVEPATDRCFRHGCSTTPGASGAPIFVERHVGGKIELKLAGLHTSGDRSAASCPGDPELDEIFNFAVAVNESTLNAFTRMPR